MSTAGQHAARQLEAITDEIMALGEQIELKRKEALAIVAGMVATDRTGTKFKVTSTRLFPGSWRLFIEGPSLKVDGSPHARNSSRSPVNLLADLS